jgi:hypothetical protein
MEAHVDLARLIEKMNEGSEEQRNEWLRRDTVPEELERIESGCGQALGTLGRWGGNKPQPGKIMLQGPRWGA